MVENGGEENLDGDMDEDDDGEEEDGDQCCATIAEVPRVELKALLGNGGFVCNGIRCTCRSEITSLMRSIKLCKNKKFKFTYEDGDRWHKLFWRGDNIQTIMSWALSMMLHQLLNWPDAFDEALWPFALEHAVYLWNHLPKSRSGLSPHELFTGSISPNRDSAWPQKTIMTWITHWLKEVPIHAFISLLNVLNHIQMWLPWSIARSGGSTLV